MNTNSKVLDSTQLKTNLKLRSNFRMLCHLAVLMRGTNTDWYCNKNENKARRHSHTQKQQRWKH